MDAEEEDRVNSCGSEWTAAVYDQVRNHIKDGYRDISFDSVWSLSSCKIDGDGFVIHELLSDNVDQYWQSDGPQPHSVTVEFPKKTDICFVAIYLDFKNDESYTPSKVQIRLGSSLMHLDETRDASFSEPNGWQIIDLRKGSLPTRVFVLQLQVLHNHQNGRDTHIRHMRVVGPSQPRFDVSKRTLLTAQGTPMHNEEGEIQSFRPLSTLALPISSLSNKFKSLFVVR